MTHIPGCTCATCPVKREPKPKPRPKHSIKVRIMVPMEAVVEVEAKDEARAVKLVEEILVHQTIRREQDLSKDELAILLELRHQTSDAFGVGIDDRDARHDMVTIWRSE